MQLSACAGGGYRRPGSQWFCPPWQNRSSGLVPAISRPWTSIRKTVPLGNGIHGAVYESLVMFNSRTLKVEPVLATSWQQVSPTQMRFKLRQA